MAALWKYTRITNPLKPYHTSHLIEHLVDFKACFLELSPMTSTSSIWKERRCYSQTHSAEHTYPLNRTRLEQNLNQSTLWHICPYVMIAWKRSNVPLLQIHPCSNWSLWYMMAGSRWNRTFILSWCHTSTSGMSCQPRMAWFSEARDWWYLPVWELRSKRTSTQAI